MCWRQPRPAPSPLCRPVPARAAPSCSRPTKERFASAKDRSRRTGCRLEVGSMLCSIFVDFPDAPGVNVSGLAPRLTTHVPWFDEVSYGRFNLSVTPVQSWFRLPRPTSSYAPLPSVDPSPRSLCRRDRSVGCRGRLLQVSSGLRRRSAGMDSRRGRTFFGFAGERDPGRRDGGSLRRRARPMVLRQWAGRPTSLEPRVPAHPRSARTSTEGTTASAHGTRWRPLSRRTTSWGGTSGYSAGWIPLS